jgi:predicted aspartyl protease
MMTTASTTGLILMLLLAGPETENPYQARVADAVRLAEERPKPAVLAEALDITWHADAWQAGRRLAKLAMHKYPAHGDLVGRAARALWRAGDIRGAEAVLGRFKPDTNDRITLRTAVAIYTARGELEHARQWADRLVKAGPHDAMDYATLFAVALERGDWEALPALVRKAESRIRDSHGYPENLLQDSIAGLAEYFEKIGPEPVNQIAQGGSAAMPPLPLVRLPACDVMINGHGPYRLVVDTGGSIMVSLDTAVAEEVGLKSIATAPIRGVSGTEDSEQALIGELAIGSIRCKRVVTRVFGVRDAVMGVADGIIGTGIFQGGRMTLDFAQGRLIVSESLDTPGAGKRSELRLIGDGKLCVPVKLGEREVVALLDTGADAVAVAPSLLEEMFPDRDHTTFAPEMQLGIGGGQLPKFTLGAGVDMDFAGRHFENYSGLGLDALDTILGPVLGIQTDVLIGMPIFRDMRSLTVDYARHQIWVDWMPPKPADE